MYRFALIKDIDETHQIRMDLHKYEKHIRSNLAILTIVLYMAFLLMLPDILDQLIFESQP